MLLLIKGTLVCVDCILWPDLNLSPAAEKEQRNQIALNLVPILGLISESILSDEPAKRNLAKLMYWNLRDDLHG